MRARVRAHAAIPLCPCLPNVYHAADATRQVDAVTVEERRQVLQPSRYVLGLRQERRVLTTGMLRALPMRAKALSPW